MLAQTMPRDCFTDAKISAKFQLGHPSGGAKYRGGIGSNRDFRPISHYISETVQDRDIFIIGSKSLYCKNSTGQNDLHVFGNNSAESEHIWIKSGTMWAKCVGLALADFGRDPRSSDSLREIVFPQKCKKSSQNFQVFRLQAIITPQWLQMPKTHGQMVPRQDV